MFYWPCLPQMETKAARLVRVEAASKTPCGRAPGYRERTNGALSGIGYYGYSWASTVNDIHSIYLGLSVTWLNTSYSNSRAYGFQLRCLSE